MVFILSKKKKTWQELIKFSVCHTLNLLCQFPNQKLEQKKSMWLSLLIKFFYFLFGSWNYEKTKQILASDSPTKTELQIFRTIFFLFIVLCVHCTLSIFHAITKIWHTLIYLHLNFHMFLQNKHPSSEKKNCVPLWQFIRFGT